MRNIEADLIDRSKCSGYRECSRCSSGIRVDAIVQHLQ